jgi:hypothetical protein
MCVQEYWRCTIMYLSLRWGLWDWIVQVWDAATGRKQYTFEGHEAPVYSVCPHHKESIQVDCTALRSFLFLCICWELLWYRLTSPCTLSLAIFLVPSDQQLFARHLLANCPQKKKFTYVSGWYCDLQFIFSTAIDGKIKAWLYDLLGSRVDYDAPGHWCTTMAYSADGTRWCEFSSSDGILNSSIAHWLDLSSVWTVYMCEDVAFFRIIYVLPFTDTQNFCDSLFHQCPSLLFTPISDKGDMT